MKKSALYCKSISFRGFPKFIRKLGGSPEILFAKAELNMSHANQGNHFYDWSKACNLFERAAVELNEPSLGIRFAHELYKDGLNSGPNLLFGALTESVRDFASLALPYQKLHINGVHYSYSEDETNKLVEFVVQTHPLSPPCRQFIEHIMTVCFLLERRLVEKAQYKTVTFQHSQPDDLSWHKKTFPCEINFNAEKNCIFADIEILNLEFSGKLTKLQPIVKMYLNKKLHDNPTYKTPISQTIESILATVLGTKKSNIKDIAEILDLSPKKIQRLLNDEGTTYSEILENVRKSLTKRLLFESDITITHLASILDYSSHEAFNTACRRWFKASPRQYRKILRDPHNQAHLI